MAEMKVFVLDSYPANVILNTAHVKMKTTHLQRQMHIFRCGFALILFKQNCSCGCPSKAQRGWWAGLLDPPPTCYSCLAACSLRYLSSRWLLIPEVRQLQEECMKVGGKGQLARKGSASHDTAGADTCLKLGGAAVTCTLSLRYSANVSQELVPWAHGSYICTLWSTAFQESCVCLGYKSIVPFDVVVCCRICVVVAYQTVCVS